MSEALTLNNLVSGTAFAAVAASPFWVPALAAGKRRRRRHAEAVVVDGKAIQLENEVNNLSLIHSIINAFVSGGSQGVQGGEIFGSVKICVFYTNIQSRFVTVVLDRFLGTKSMNLSFHTFKYLEFT